MAHETVINSLCNSPESAKTASVDDQDVDAPWGSSMVEIAPGPKIVINSPCNGPESAKTVSVDNLDVNAL